jgi:hypothetical protein
MLVKVEPLLFCGVDNPSFRLSADDSVYVRRLFSLLKRLDAMPPESHVGYSGMLVTLEGDPDGDGPLHALQVQNGVVEEFLPSGETLMYRDSIGLEQFLMSRLWQEPGYINARFPELT